MPHLPKSVGHHGTDLIAGAVGAFEIGKARLDRGVALFQGIIGGIADQRRIIAVIGGIGLTKASARRASSTMALACVKSATAMLAVS